MTERMGDIEAALCEWLGDGWTVTVQHRGAGRINIDAAHPLSHGMGIHGTDPRRP